MGNKESLPRRRGVTGVVTPGDLEASGLHVARKPAQPSPRRATELLDGGSR